MKCDPCARSKGPATSSTSVGSNAAVAAVAAAAVVDDAAIVAAAVAVTCAGGGAPMDSAAIDPANALPPAAPAPLKAV